MKHYRSKTIIHVSAQGDHIIPIPGTTRLENLENNVAVTQVELGVHDLTSIMDILRHHTVQGERYTAEGMKGVNG